MNVLIFLVIGLGYVQLLSNLKMHDEILVDIADTVIHWVEEEMDRRCSNTTTDSS